MTDHEISETPERIAKKVGSIASKKAINAHYETALKNSVGFP